MRLWSLHPKYLDLKGLIALWREGLLAKKVLENKTKGYKNHPQLIRFKNCRNPQNCIRFYLYHVYLEAKKRGFNFNQTKIWPIPRLKRKIKITDGQLKFEFNHLLKKLKKRDKEKYKELLRVKKFLPHSLFQIIKGKKEKWEKANR